MLNDHQIQKVWQNMLAAETRSLYFGDLANRYTSQKQWMTGITFFLSSGAAVTIIAKLNAWIPVMCSLFVAFISAYSIALNLDGKTRTMAKLHSTWNEIALAYERLWNHTYDTDAEDELTRILRMEDEPSQLATTSAPNDQELLGKWQQQVFRLHGLPTGHA
jgi:hypothetical protein